MGNVSNLSPSVQKLLRDFASDSDELAKPDPASAFRSPPHASPSEKHASAAEGLGDGVDDWTTATEDAPSANESQTGHAPAVAAAHSQFETVSKSITDTLPLRPDITQVLLCRCLRCVAFMLCCPCYTHISLRGTLISNTIVGTDIE